jgi:histidyl-tRNA synthetase
MNFKEIENIIKPILKTDGFVNTIKILNELGEKIGSSHNHKKVMQIITKSGKYKALKVGESTATYDISISETYMEWYKKIDWATLLITFILSITGTYITNEIQEKAKTQELRKILDTLEVQKASLNELKKFAHKHQYKK